MALCLVIFVRKILQIRAESKETFQMFMKEEKISNVKFVDKLFLKRPTKMLALHKQYTNCPSNLAGNEAENLLKSLLFIRNIHLLAKFT